jgi:DNA-binding NtrC family response regulator
METKRILAVDEEQDLLDALQFLFKNQNFKVVTARNCKSGLKISDHHGDIQITREVWNE